MNAAGPGGRGRKVSGTVKDVMMGGYFSSTSLSVEYPDVREENRKRLVKEYVHLDTVEGMVPEWVGRLGGGSHVGDGCIIDGVRVESHPRERSQRFEEYSRCGRVRHVHSGIMDRTYLGPL